eukprot:TRINITY_DN4141_c0_g1_i3.p1 TRINITY_DN4141_c0_g1~~TRINITY_DN4141_c0_g1_i3.p1  ORF type:complete len:280 (-),score=9.51 TRINITY_DN4141_c0_g1_i3:752-1591(-)
MSLTTNTTPPGGNIVKDGGFTSVVHGVAIITDTISALFSLVVVISLTFCTNLRKPRLWKMILGIAVADLVYAIHHGADHALSFQDPYSWPTDGPACTYLGVGAIAGFFMESAWIIAMAGSLLFEFMQDVIEKPQRISMKLIYLWIAFWSICPWIIGLGLGAIGPVGRVQPTWCQFNALDRGISFGLFEFWMWFFNILLILIYFLLALRFKKLISKGVAFRSVGRRVLRKMILFPLAYTFQWIFYTVYLLLEYVGVSATREYIYHTPLNNSSQGPIGPSG